MERVLLFWFAWLVPPIALFVAVSLLCESRWTVVGTALAVLLYGLVAHDPIGSLILPWQVVYSDRSTEKQIEVWGRPTSYPVQANPPPWFREAVTIVRGSIARGVTAQVALSIIVVYKRLRIRRRNRTDRLLGVVAPNLTSQGIPSPTMFLSRRGSKNWRILYEETAHSLRRQTATGWLRFGNSPAEHLRIFEGLCNSVVFARLAWWDRWWLLATIQELRGGRRPGLVWRCFWKVIRWARLYL
jgi:hypothetical protein